MGVSLQLMIATVLHLDKCFSTCFTLRIMFEESKIPNKTSITKKITACSLKKITVPQQQPDLHNLEKDYQPKLRDKKVE